jgi:hypothetical protein
MTEQRTFTYTYCVFHVDGSVTLHSAEMSRPPTLDQIYAAVLPHLNGADSEHVSVLHRGRRADMFVNGNGRAFRLPRNDNATAVYRCNWLTRYPTADPEAMPYIVGPAVLFDQIVWT